MGYVQLNPTGVGIANSKAALKALVATGVTVAVLLMEGQTGMFGRVDGDYSAYVTADTTEAIYMAIDGVATTTAAIQRQYDQRANVKWFADAGTDLAMLQAATDLVDSVWVPNGDYNVGTGTSWLLDDNAVVEFESLNARVISTWTSPTGWIIKARGGSSYRNFFIRIISGAIIGPTAGGGVNGIDFLSTSYARIEGTFINKCNDGVRFGGSGSLGAFYNVARDFIMTDIGVGIRCNTLGNENRFGPGRIGSCVVGTDDNDGTCNTYDQIAIEGFTTTAHRVCNGGVTSQRVRYIFPRLENSGGVGASIIISAAAESTVVIGEFFTGTASGVTDSGTGTDHLAAY